MKCVQIKFREVVTIAMVMVLSQTMALWWPDGQVITAQVSRPIASESRVAATSGAGKKSTPDASYLAYPRHTGFNPMHPWLP